MDMEKMQLEAEERRAIIELLKLSWLMYTNTYESIVTYEIISVLSHIFPDIHFSSQDKIVVHVYMK